MRKFVFCIALVGSLAVRGETVVMKTAAATCTVETHGARVISYKTAAQGEILWNADPVQTEDAAWAHGGIPVCWPWFSKNAEGVYHGFAWKRPFRIASRRESSVASELVLRLETSEATLTYTMLLRDKSLKLTLETTNVSAKAFGFSAALHPYFRLGERDRATLAGVRDEPFALTSAIDGAVPGPKGSPKVYRLADPVLDRTLSLSADNTGGVCTWNPGTDRKSVPGNLPPGAERHFVCVEPTVGFPGTICLKPGGKHAFSYEICPTAGAAVSSGRAASFTNTTREVR